MRLLKMIPLIAFLLIGLTSGLNAQQTNVFTFNTISGSEVVKAKSGEQAITYFDLNKDLFSNPDFKKGAIFEFYTASGEPIKLQVQRVEEFVPGTRSIIASKRGTNERIFTATFKNGVVHGLYHQSHEKSFKIGFEGQQYLKENAASENLGCGLHENEDRFVAFSPKGDHTRSLKAKTAYGTYESSPASLTASLDDSITIDLMIVYTDAAEDWAYQEDGGGNVTRDIDLVIAEAMSLSQTALDNSELEIQLRLVHTYKTDYDELNDFPDDFEDPSNERLNRFTQNPDQKVDLCFGASGCDPDQWDGYMEDVHDLRVQYGADIVSLFVRIDDTGGLGWRLGNTGGSPSFGFNLNRVQQVANGYTVIHEIGHNMGNSHSRTQATAEAGPKGGLFHYSAGFQDTENNFHTVMAYSDGLEQAPIFSSPDLSWEGAPMGTNDNETPENNAMSMSQIKRTIAGYLPSIIDAPSASVSTNEIIVDMNREEQIPVTVQLSNSGASSLMWTADFKFAENTVNKRSKTKRNVVDEMQGIAMDYPIVPMTNQSLPKYRAKSSQDNHVIYSTSFETEEGFTTGSYKAISDWRSDTDSDFLISADAPNIGSQHYRLEYGGQTDDGGNAITLWNSTPFFGYQQFGSYEVTFSFQVGGTNADSEMFDFYIYDGKTRNFSAGIIIGNGTIFSADLTETGDITFTSNGTPAPAGSYHDMRIVYNNEEGVIEYYLNGSPLAENSYLGGYTPGVIRILHRNTVSGTYMNVDDVQIRQLDTPYTWLTTDIMAGVANEGESSQIDLTFDTRGVSAGTYETTMVINTNDPANPVYEIPVTVTVNDAVSNENETVPNQISLYQNYPNPFNPTTNIQFELAESSEVTLEVFDMTGRKVATLVSGNKTAGEHSVQFNAANAASGVYLYKLTTPSQTITRQMVLIK